MRDLRLSPWLRHRSPPLLLAALLLTAVPARGQLSSLDIQGSGNAATSAHVTITQSGSASAYLCPDTINVYTGASITYWGPEAICNAPLAEKIISFTAAYLVQRGQVRVRWATASEEGLAGFYVQRRLAPAGRTARLMSALIPSRGDATVGDSYEVLDAEVAAGKTYDYLLEVVGQDGKSSFTNPVRLKIPEPKADDPASPPGATGSETPDVVVGQTREPDEALSLSGCSYGPGAGAAAPPASLALLLLVAGGFARRRTCRRRRTRAAAGSSSRARW